MKLSNLFFVALAVIGFLVIQHQLNDLAGRINFTLSSLEKTNNLVISEGKAIEVLTQLTSPN